MLHGLSLSLSRSGSLPLTARYRSPHSPRDATLWLCVPRLAALETIAAPRGGAHADRNDNETPLTQAPGPACSSEPTCKVNLRVDRDAMLWPPSTHARTPFQNVSRAPYRASIASLSPLAARVRPAFLPVRASLHAPRGVTPLGLSSTRRCCHLPWCPPPPSACSPRRHQAPASRTHQTPTCQQHQTPSCQQHRRSRGWRSSGLL